MLKIKKSIKIKSILILFFASFFAFFSFIFKTFSADTYFENEYRLNVNDYSFKEGGVDLKNFQIFNEINEFRLKSHIGLPDYVLKKGLTSSRLFFYKSYHNQNEELSVMYSYGSQFFVIVDPSRYRKDNKLTIDYKPGINFYWDLEDLENQEKPNNNTCLYIDFDGEDKKKLEGTCYANLLTAKPFILFGNFKINYKSPYQYLYYPGIYNQLKYVNGVNEIVFSYATSYVKDFGKKINNENDEVEDSGSGVILGIKVPKYNVITHNLSDYLGKYREYLSPGYAAKNIHKEVYNNLFDSGSQNYLSREAFSYLYLSSFSSSFELKYSNGEFKPYSIRWLSEDDFKNFEGGYVKISQLEPEKFKDKSIEYFKSNDIIYGILRYPSKYVLEQFSVLIMNEIYGKPKDYAIWELLDADKYKECEGWNFLCIVAKNLGWIPSKPQTGPDGLPIDKPKTLSGGIIEGTEEISKCNNNPECIKKEREKMEGIIKNNGKLPVDGIKKSDACGVNIGCYIQNFTNVFSGYINFMKNDFSEILKNSLSGFFSNLFNNGDSENFYNLKHYEDCRFYNIFCHGRNIIKFLINSIIGIGDFVFNGILNKVINIEPVKFVKNILTGVYNFFEPLFKTIYKVATFQYDFNTLFWGDQNFVCSNLPNGFFQEYINFGARKPLEALGFLWFFINPFPPEDGSHICTSLGIKQINYGRDTILDGTIFLFFFISGLWFPFIFLNKSK